MHLAASLHGPGPPGDSTILSPEMSRASGTLRYSICFRTFRSSLCGSNSFWVVPALGERWWGCFAAQPSGFTLGRLLLLLVARTILDRHHDVGALFAEALQVELFDELGQGQLPSFLTMVVELPQALGFHAQFARHLNMRMGEMMALAGVDPLLEVVGYAFARHRHTFGVAQCSSAGLPALILAATQAIAPLVVFQAFRFSATHHIASLSSPQPTQSGSQRGRRF